MGDALKIALVTVSDTRTAENDTSGDYLADALSGIESLLMFFFVH